MGYDNYELNKRASRERLLGRRVEEVMGGRPDEGSFDGGVDRADGGGFGRSQMVSGKMWDMLSLDERVRRMKVMLENLEARLGGLDGKVEVMGEVVGEMQRFSNGNGRNGVMI